MSVCIMAQYNCFPVHLADVAMYHPLVQCRIDWQICMYIIAVLIYINTTLSVSRVIDSCQEAFILRLYRQKNKVSCTHCV